MEYAVGYNESIVHDPSWACVADVIASYHGTTYVDDDRRVTGDLLIREPGAHWRAA